ncbi:MAG: YicC family protein [Candidatus Eisenbacteria bacterium]|nr:YicC family protein [Candidatus Eisenbacteria bacterium]
MLRSMTGYGSSEKTDEERSVRVEIRSVNQRFLDVQIKAPRVLFQVEDRIRSLVESALSRGRVTVYVEWRSTADMTPAVNLPAARALIRQLRGLSEELSVSGEVNLDILTRFTQIFEQSTDASQAEDVWSALEPAMSEAMRRLIEMRETEGAKLSDELADRLSAIEGVTGRIEQVAPDASAMMKDRLSERLSALLSGSVPVDETRIAQEVAIAAERADFTEEVVRLRAHVGHARECLDNTEPVGKRLNFIVQEMHREANTIGSKGGDLGITESVLTLKEEIEKLREQVQNVE